MELHPRKEVIKKREVSKHQENTLTAESVASLGTTGGNITGWKNK